MGAGLAELAGLRRILVRLLLDGIAHGDPAAAGAGNGTLNQDETALDVGLDDLEVERGDAIDTHVAGHLLVLEGLARVLTAAGRTDRTVRDRDTVRGTQTAEIPALHTAGKTLTDRDAADVDELTFNEMVGSDFGTHRDHRVFGDAEFSELAAWLDIGLGEVTTVGLAHIVGTAHARSELKRDVTVLVLGAVGNDLALLKLQHRDRHVFSGLGEHPGHSDLFCDDTRTHFFQSLSRRLQLDLDVDTCGEVELHQRVHGLRGRVDNVQKTLMRAHFELFAALLVDMGRAVHRELLDARRQRDRSTNLSASALGRVHDLTRRRIEDAVVERLEPDPNILAVHFCFSRPSHPPLRKRRASATLIPKQRRGWPGFKPGHNTCPITR